MARPLKFSHGQDPDQTLQFSRAREELAQLIWIKERYP
jgi:hypothetical protein